MKILSKLPLYTGVTVFVLTILVSAVAVGQKTSLTTVGSRASVGQAALSMTFVSPNTLSFTVSSQKSIAGVDATIHYNPAEVFIIASSLHGGVAFATTGGDDNPSNGTFSFSALPSGEVTSGIVASLTIQPKIPGQPTSTTFSFDNSATKVLEKGTLQNIAGEMNGVQATL